MNSTVSWGPASIIGVIGIIATAIIPFIGELRDSLAPLGVPNQTWVIISGILTAATVLGRMYQAAQQAAAVGAVPADQGDAGSGGIPPG